MPSLFFFLRNRGEKLLSHTSGKLLRAIARLGVVVRVSIPRCPNLHTFFRTGLMWFHYNFHTPMTHRCLHTILKAYTEVYAILAYSSVVERLTVNQDVAGSIPAMPVMSTLVQKPMSAMEEQRLAVDIILLLSTNIDNDGSGTV